MKIDGQLLLFPEEVEERNETSVKTHRVNRVNKKSKKQADPAQSYDERMKRFWHYFNHKNCYENQIETCVGELQWIVDALADYRDIVSKEIASMQGYDRAVWEIQMERLEKAQKKIEESLGYSRDEALVLCMKKRNKKETDDIGGDALELSLMRR